MNLEQKKWWCNKKQKVYFFKERPEAGFNNDFIEGIKGVLEKGTNSVIVIIP
jgi:hypothetical protein